MNHWTLFERSTTSSAKNQMHQMCIDFPFTFCERENLARSAHAYFFITVSQAVRKCLFLG